VFVADEVLAAQEHHVRCFRGELFEFAEAFKRVFAQEAEGGVNRCAAPRFETVEADAVEEWRDWAHLCERHTGRRERLMSVAQDGVVECSRCAGHKN